MSNKCEKCGHEIDGESPICMNCGFPVPKDNLTEETKKRLEESKVDTVRASNASSARAIGAVLIIFGILADVVSMFLIFSEGSAAFSAVTIIGTIITLIGFLLFANG